MIFLSNQPEERKRLKSWPIHVLGFSLQAEEVRSLFAGIRIRDAAELECRSRKAVPYLAVSLVSMTEEEMDEVLSDPLCRGLWILLQDPDHLSFQKTDRSLKKKLRLLLNGRKKEKRPGS